MGPEVDAQGGYLPRDQRPRRKGRKCFCLIEWTTEISKVITAGEPLTTSTTFTKRYPLFTLAKPTEEIKEGKNYHRCEGLAACVC